MAKKSQTIKEIIQIVVFLVVVGLLLVTFVIYPLGRTKEIMARADVDEFNEDSLPPNHITLLEDTSLSVDTMRIDSDGLTTLAVAYVVRRVAEDSAMVPLRGTAILVHHEVNDREAMIPLARRLLDSGLAVVLYDQRASGSSSGTYHSDGQYEAGDLEEIVAYLALRERLPSPVMVVGRGIGGDAALLAALDDSRISTVVAVGPYLTTDRWYSLKREASGMWWIPFPNSLMSFWFEIRSGYAMEERTPELFEPVACPTLIIGTPGCSEDPTVQQFVELSSVDLLTTLEMDMEPEALNETIVDFLMLSHSALTE